jgi:hypothetical protein
MITFRDQVAAKIRPRILIVHINEEGVKAGINPV